MPIQQIFLGLGAADTFTVATGGTITTDGDHKVHAFTSTGTFTVTQLGTTNEFEVLTVSGGASASSNTNTTGGAGGGLITHATAQALSQDPYTITIGGGGAQISFNAFGALGNHGSDSSVALQSNGNVVVDSDVSDLTNGANSQCHGDGTTSTRSSGGASLKKVDGTITQFTGGSGGNGAGGGAGGGANGNSGSGNNGGAGGAGFATTITGSSANLGGGGGGGSFNSSNSFQASGGSGGGGTGAGFNNAATSGSANTGGGGGGTKSGYFGGGNFQGGAGGSGIVYIRYKFQ